MKITYPFSANHFEAEDFGFILKGDKTSYSSRPSIYVLLFNDDKKIASINFREDIGRIYPLPGGGVNEGEEWEEGLIREIKEEIGCTIQDIKPIGSFGSYDNSTMKCFQSVVCTAMLRGEPQTPQSTEGYEQGAKLIWITMEELIEKLEELANPADNLKDDRSHFTLKILKNASINLKSAREGLPY